MFRKTACALTLMFSGLSIAQPAAAATILITYTGTVVDGSDGIGLFGDPNKSLMNAKFTSVYTLTYPSQGSGENISNPGIHVIYGGTSFNQSPPSPLSGQLTINGRTVSVDGQYRGEHTLISPGYQGGNTSQILDFVYSNQNKFLVNVILNISGDNFISSLNFADELSHTVISSDESRGGFSTTNDSGQSTQANFKNLTVSVQEVSAVPEPATWGMMIFGFGIAGVTLRVRRREAALA